MYKAVDKDKTIIADFEALQNILKNFYFRG